MTQMGSARQGIITPAMHFVAQTEQVAAEAVRAAIAEGTAVIPLNPHHTNCQPVGVGRLFSTKINANLGRSVARSGKGDELAKLAVALEAGADFVMDLSTGDDVKSIRQGMLDHSPTTANLQQQYGQVLLANRWVTYPQPGACAWRRSGRIQIPPYSLSVFLIIILKAI